MSRVINKVAIAATAALVAGLAFTGSIAPAVAAETCPGMSAPANANAGNQAPSPTNDTAVAQSGGSVVINVLANDTDPEGDHLYVTGTSNTPRGTTCVGSKGLIRYTPNIWRKDRTDIFTYGVTDGDRYRTATVTVQVDGLMPLKPVVTKRLVLKKGGKVKQRAVLTVTNPNGSRMWFVAGPPHKGKAVASRFIYPGHSFTFSTKERRLIYFSLLVPKSLETFIMVNQGGVNTRTGAVSSQYVGDSFFRTSQARSGQAPSVAELRVAAR